MKKTSIVMAITISLLLSTTSLAFASKGSPDFNYVANPPYVQVSPDIVVPNDVPFCSTANTHVPTYPLLYCLSPNFLQVAYNFEGAYDAVGGISNAGAGQTIVIVDAYGSPTITSDLKKFDTTFGIPDPPSFKIQCDPQGCPALSPNNFPLDELGWTIETTLDVEYAHALAPAANIVLVVASSPAGNAINTAEKRAISLYPGSVMSQSFGIPEYAITANNAQLLQAEKNYQAAANAGITVLASAGDTGAGNGINTANALFPSSDPLVTAVGGTQGYPLGSGLATFTTGCSPGPRPGYPSGCTPTGYGAEQVWNEAWDGIATGGAPSLIFSAPSYQPFSLTGHATRTTPDISLNAAVDGGVLVYWSACLACISPTFSGWFVVGGTSASSPEWASIFAVANQLRAAGGHGPLGFVNPTLYSIAQSSYSSDFHDITVGDNTVVGTTVGFGAGAGYDLASGWGTPNVANLVADLASS